MRSVPRSLPVAFAFLILAASCAADSAPAAPPDGGYVRLDRVTSSRPLPNGIEIRSGAALIEITALRDDVLRMRVGPRALPEDASWAVLAAARTASVAVTPLGNAAEVGFTTAKLRLSVQKETLAITISDLDGHVIAQTMPARPIEYHGGLFSRLLQLADRRALLWIGRQAWPARPAQRGFQRLEHGQLRLAGIHGPALQIDSLLHDVQGGHYGRDLSGQYLEDQLRLQQGVPRRLLVGRGGRTSGLLLSIWAGAEGGGEDLGLAHGPTPLPPLWRWATSSPAGATIPKPRCAASPTGCAANAFRPT